MASSAYLNIFRKTIVWSQDLKDPNVRESYALKGYNWVRRADPKHFHKIVRQPTVGFYVELFVEKHPGTIHIDAEKTQRLLDRTCYFTHDIRWS
jgi:hypothetical protein